MFNSSHGAFGTRSVKPLVWSDHLGLSASQFVEKLSGCNHYYPTIYDDGDEHEEIRNIAQFDDHKRFVFYPEKFPWSNPQEAVFDWMTADNYHFHEVAWFLLSEQFNQIGIACDCHNAFSNFCVVEFGTIVRDIPEHKHELEDHIWQGRGRDFNYTFELFENRDRRNLQLIPDVETIFGDAFPDMPDFEGIPEGPILPWMLPRPPTSIDLPGLPDIHATDFDPAIFYNMTHEMV